MLTRPATVRVAGRVRTGGLGSGWATWTGLSLICGNIHSCTACLPRVALGLNPGDRMGALGTSVGTRGIAPTLIVVLPPLPPRERPVPPLMLIRGLFPNPSASVRPRVVRTTSRTSRPEGLRLSKAPLYCSSAVGLSVTGFGSRLGNLSNGIVLSLFPRWVAGWSHTWHEDCK